MKISIQAAEGGSHSKTIVNRLAKVYSKYLEGRGWLHQIDYADGSATITCRDIPDFLNEAGGHRWQEVSPTDKRGRVHTSTVTIGVLLDSMKQIETPYDLREDKHFSYTTFSGTGCGGSHRNKHQVSIRMTHVPTGLTQKAEGRIKDTNIQQARERLIEMLDAEKARQGHATVSAIVKEQRGAGQRGDKFRTYRFQDDTIADHRTGKTTSCRSFMKGEIERLWWCSNFSLELLLKSGRTVGSTGEPDGQPTQSFEGTGRKCPDGYRHVPRL